MPRSVPCIRSRRLGFTLTEALVAITLTSMAGAALLLSTQGALSTNEDALDETIAQGLAEQMIDEVLGATYGAKGANPRDTYLGPNAWETQGSGRERYSDTDDFNGFRAQPAVDRWGSSLGRGNGAGGTRHASLALRSGYFTKWRQEIDIYYVSESDPSVKLGSGQTSYVRAVEVRIFRDDGNGRRRPLATVRRVYAYVPPGS